jgi:peptidoglycan/LPS O-acetylase OafA/YrhL
MKQNHELAGIEVMRFFCAFGVLIWHYQHFFFVGEWDSVVGQALRPTLPLYHLLSVFYDNGSLAVPFFWVISGFIFYWHYSEAIRHRSVLFAEFVLRRFSRLYPLHFVTLILVAVGQYVYYISHQTAFIYIWNKPIWFASQLLFASNWFSRQPESFNAPIWSVSIEILIYLFFFLIARTFRPSALSSACIAVAFAACFNFLHSFINPQVFACGMYFFAGGVAQRLTAYRYALPVAICAAAATLTALSFGTYSINVASILFLATSSVIVFAKLGETVVGVPFRFLAFLGNATYSSYLLHFPIQLALVIVVDAIGWKRDIFYSPSVFLGFLALVIGVSLLVHRYFEMPAQSAIRMGVKPYLGKSPLQGRFPG